MKICTGGIVKLLKLWCKFIPIGGFRIGPLGHLDGPIRKICGTLLGKEIMKTHWVSWCCGKACREGNLTYPAFERWFCRNDVTWWSYDHFCKNVHHALARYWARRAKSFSKIRWTMLTIWQESHPNHTSDSFRITPGAGVSSSCASTKLSGPKESQHL